MTNGTGSPLSIGHVLGFVCGVLLFGLAAAGFEWARWKWEQWRERRKR